MSLPLTPRWTRPWYYAASAGTLVTRLRGPWRGLPTLLRRRPVSPVTIRLRDSGLCFDVRDLMDVWTLKEVCLDRDYERAAVPLEDGWTIIDIGAGIGAFAVDAAARCRTARVIAFEPSPDSARLLARNIESNGLLNVEVHACAIGASDAPCWLDVSTPHAVMHHVTAVGRDGAVAVPQLTLAGLLAQCGVTTCDFLKMDCEGSEYDILLAADRQTLERVQRLCLEYHDDASRNHRQLVDALAAAGFVVTLTPNRAYREIGFLYACRPTDAVGHPRAVDDAP